jgi:hypothetical protein
VALLIDGASPLLMDTWMKLFNCQNCSQVLYFENSRCERCGFQLGYRSQNNTIVTLRSVGNVWQALSDSGHFHRFCANAQYDACNWILPAETSDIYCVACRHNRVVPDLSRPENVTAWRKIEIAKHRLFYSLLRLGLTDLKGLEFDFLDDPLAADNPTVMTGHDGGRITIALAEANDAEREKRRAKLNEPYRELLGHFRHEIGHYFWDRLVHEGGKTEEFREVFGDQNQDYSVALQSYYYNGPPPDWRGNFVSSYAAAHPWEDFAETWAHYLHIVDTLEMADAFGIEVNPRLDIQGELTAEINVDPYLASNFAPVVAAWLPLTFALKSINRCMGQPDLYPFILLPGVINKLDFVHRLIRNKRLHPDSGRPT